MAEGEPRPAWVAFDKQVLAFDGYFEETAISPPEFRVRPVKVYFYLEDDTVQVGISSYLRHTVCMLMRR